MWNGLASSLSTVRGLEFSACRGRRGVESETRRCGQSSSNLDTPLIRLGPTRACILIHPIVRGPLGALTLELDPNGP